MAERLRSQGDHRPSEPVAFSELVVAAVATAAILRPLNGPLRLRLEAVSLPQPPLKSVHSIPTSSEARLRSLPKGDDLVPGRCSREAPATYCLSAIPCDGPSAGTAVCPRKWRSRARPER